MSIRKEQSAVCDALMHYGKIITWATNLFNTFCWGYMNAEYGIFHIDPTTQGSPSLEKRNLVLLSLWCFTHSTCSQHNPQHIDIRLASKGYKNTLFFFSSFKAEICSGNVFSHDHPKRQIQMNFSTRVWNHINSNYASCSKEEICPWESSACHPRSCHQVEHLLHSPSSQQTTHTKLLVRHIQALFRHVPT